MKLLLIIGYKEQKSNGSRLLCDGLITNLKVEVDYL